MPGAQIQFPRSGPPVLGTMGSRFLARLIDGFIVGIPSEFPRCCWLSSLAGSMGCVSAVGDSTDSDAALRQAAKTYVISTKPMY